MSPELNDRIGAAYALQRAGQAALAERHCREILADVPGQTDVLYLLSSLILPSRPEEAMALARQALEAFSAAGGGGVSEAEVHANFARCVRWSAGDPAVEMEHLQRARQLDSGSVGRQLQFADAQQRAGRITDAVETLSQCLRDHPGDGDTMAQLGMALLLIEQVELAIAHLEQAVRLLPEHLDAWVSLGAAYEKASNADAAAQAFERALQVNPEDPRARYGLNEIHIKRIPRWHFGMMNDRSRNEAYDFAIDQVVKSVRKDIAAPLVLDIGAGSGLLSMMAARSGAGQVVACEVVEPVAKKAQEIVARNGYGQCVSVVNAKSTDLRVGESLPRRADVLVTEIFDAGLLGENVLPVLAHARAHLLTEGAAIVPAGAQVWMMPIESEEIFEDHYVRKQNACGFDLEAFNEFSTLRYVQLPIRQFKYEAFCAPVPVLDFDFSRDVDNRNAVFEILPTRGGVVHAWVFWFTLLLDGETRYDTGPYNRRTHWRQAVQLEPALPTMSRGRPIKLRVNQTQNNIRFFLER